MAESSEEGSSLMQCWGHGLMEVHHESSGSHFACRDVFSCSEIEELPAECLSLRSQEPQFSILVLSWPLSTCTTLNKGLGSS